MSEKKEEAPKTFNILVFFKGLEESVVKEIIEIFYEGDDEILEAKFDQQVQALSDDALVTGIAGMLKKCTKPILMDMDEEFKENNSTKPMMVQKLTDTFYEKGVDVFLEKLDTSVISSVATKVLRYDTQHESKETLIGKLKEDIYMQGLAKFFEHFTVNDLRTFCTLLKIIVKSSSKKRLAKAIIHNKDMGQVKTMKNDPVDLPEIDKSITKVDLLKYKVVDMRNYCKTVGIKKAGNKNVLVDRIMRFNQGEKVELEDDSTTKKRSRSKKKSDGDDGDDSYDDGDAPVKKRKKNVKKDNSDEESGENNSKNKKGEKDDGKEDSSENNKTKEQDGEKKR